MFYLLFKKNEHVELPGVVNPCEYGSSSKQLLLLLLLLLLMLLSVPLLLRRTYFSTRESKTKNLNLCFIRRRCINSWPVPTRLLIILLCPFQDALLDMLRRSRIQFVHCILPKADALKALSGSLFKGVECETQGESGDPSLMQLDVALLRAQIRGSKLLDALRIYRQGEVKQTYPLVHVY